jgi:hypothetical protein
LECELLAQLFKTAYIFLIEYEANTPISSSIH